MKKYTLLFSVLFIVFSCKKEPQLLKVSGPIFGTSYSIQYFDLDGTSYNKQFDSLFAIINKSMSNYQDNSDISRLNRNEEVEVDNHFTTVFKASKQIYRETEGVLDPTIGRIVNAWNFGSEKNTMTLDSVKIDSLMRFVGLNRVGLVDRKIKKPEASFIDFNAIAKGYGVDVIADFLESKNIKNYIVDIGGELRAKGINVSKAKGWTVGIENPNYDGSQSYNETLVLKDQAMATSGTYRKFKIDENGNKYAHIINTKTGYPSKTNILSVSVIAKTCMMADGYATAFQAMGMEKVDYFMAKHPELKAFLIFENDKGELESKAFNNFPVN
ncbi:MULTISPECIES: FAD:protein FMN transferase [unclassified Olleya]|jgi:thiamine biosynthesis lipoprotein|uniref:FAD:protein FMN transferase n=1 Tax=unclassified Olleya TaxID=2615019 RepID=UPI00119EFCC5|nr:FAD:protein FMN transferase [Olleya sp. Hel_I_94]TVZ48608.1 thiamine biosynthesis lipoprotein [Olleya sp. Hel_I_94]